MLQWYNSVVRAQNWAVHTSPKSAAENFSDQGNHIVFNYCGNEEQMVPALFQSYLIYKMFIQNMDTAFNCGLKLEIENFEKNDHVPIFKKIIGKDK